MKRGGAKPITVRVRAVPTERTDLMCIGCGAFRTELAIETGWVREPLAGLHKSCVPHVKIARGAA